MDDYRSECRERGMNKTSLVPSNAQKSWWVNSWNGATNGIGQYYMGTNGSAGALLRGGSWDMGSGSGVFTGHQAEVPSGTSTNYGFRCVFRPASP